jgi:hypothetical protein
MKTKELACFRYYSMIDKELATNFTLDSRASGHIGEDNPMNRWPDHPMSRSRYSNSEHDMKYPHRWQTILQRWDSRRVEQTGQNWLGNSGTPGDFAVGGTAG